MAASKRRPVWVIIPAKSLRRIGVIKQSRSAQSFSSPDELDKSAANQSGTSQDPIQQPSPQRLTQENISGGKSNNAATENPPAGNVELDSPSVAIDNSSVAHCEVERRRKRKIAVSIQTLAEMLQLKEVDPKKLAKADILKLALNQILKLKAANTELEENISKYASQEEEEVKGEESQTSNRRQLDDRLEELLMEHISLKRQLQQLSHRTTDSSIDCRTRCQNKISVEKAVACDSPSLEPFTNSSSEKDQERETTGQTSANVSNNSAKLTEKSIKDPAERGNEGLRETSEEFLDCGSEILESVRNRSVGLRDGKYLDTDQDPGLEAGSNGDEVMMVNPAGDGLVCPPCQSEELALADDQHDKVNHQAESVKLSESVDARGEIDLIESEASLKLSLADVSRSEELKNSSGVEASDECVSSTEAIGDLSSDIFLSSSSGDRVLINTPPGARVSNTSPSSARVLTATLAGVNNSPSDGRTMADAGMLIDTPSDDRVLIDTPSDDRVLIDTPSDDRVLIDTPSDDRVLIDTPSDDRVLIDNPSDARVLIDTRSDARILHSTLPNGEALNSSPLDDVTKEVLFDAEMTAVPPASMNESVDHINSDPKESEKSPSRRKEPIHGTRMLDCTSISPISQATACLHTLQQSSLSSASSEEESVIAAKKLGIYRLPGSDAIICEDSELAVVQQHREPVYPTTDKVSAFGNPSSNPKGIPASIPTAVIAGNISGACAVSAASSETTDVCHSLSSSPSKITSLDSPSSPSPLPSHSSSPSISSRMEHPVPPVSPLGPDSSPFSSSSSSLIPGPSHPIISSSVSSHVSKSKVGGHQSETSNQPWPVSSLLSSQHPIPRSGHCTNSSTPMSGSDNCGVLIPTSISNDWSFAPGHSRCSEQALSSSIPDMEASAENIHSAVASPFSSSNSADGQNPIWTTTISTSSRKRKSKHAGEADRWGGEEEPVDGATTRKTARTGEGIMPNKQDSATLLNCGPAVQLSRVMSTDSSRSNPSQASYGRTVRTNSTCAQVCPPQAVDFRHCETFTDLAAQHTPPAPPTSTQSTPSSRPVLPSPPTSDQSIFSAHPVPEGLPIPAQSSSSTQPIHPALPTSAQSAIPTLSNPTAPPSQPACSTQQGQDLHLYTHHHHRHRHYPSPAIVQPWIDHSHNQVNSAHLARLPHYCTDRACSIRSTPSNFDHQRRTDQYRQWNNSSSHLQSLADPDMPHPFPQPPSQLLLPHQHLDSLHQTPPPHFPSPEYDPWSYGIRGDAFQQVTGGPGGWSSRLPPPPSTYLQYGTNLSSPTAGGVGVATGRQWHARNSQQRCHPPTGFMSHDHITCDSMTTSPFPGVWRPYSETNSLPANPPPHPQSRDGYCSSEATAPSMPSHQQLHFPFLDPIVQPSTSRLHFSDHGGVPQSSCSQSIAIRDNLSNHRAHMGRASAHPQTHYLQMEPTPTARQHSCSDESAPPPSQHPHQLMPTQPSSRTESFFVDRLLYDIG